jgi:hypothetical protein
MNKKPSQFSFSVDKIAYAPGETIRFSVLCDNEASSRELKSIRCELFLNYKAVNNEHAKGEILICSDKFDSKVL